LWYCWRQLLVWCVCCVCFVWCSFYRNEQNCKKWVDARLCTMVKKTSKWSDHICDILIILILNVYNSLFSVS
jgi:hypothetical protein